MTEKGSNSDTPEESEDIAADEATLSGEDGENSCPTCGAEIPPDAPEGLCPKCALADAAAPTDIDLTAPTLADHRFEAPTIETIAAAFPQLEIVELIGCGGMGAVYKARQPHLDRFVALKVLPPSLAETPAFTERFTREGRLLAKLSHPNIVLVHDFGQAGGFFYLMMEYVDGANLRQAMRAGRFTPEQALTIVPKICEALQFAHNEGILHRDIKPENILLDTRGQVKIADFGIAKLFGDAAFADPTVTGTGTAAAVPGTPHYMAPEQIEHPGEVDHRADIYSLGVVFYELLTGELPLGRFPAPSEKAAVDTQIDEIVFRSLEKERDRRQQSAGEVKTQIEGVPFAAIAAERHPAYGIPTGAALKSPSGGRKAAGIVLAGVLVPVLLSLIWIIGIRFQRGNEMLERAQSEQSRVEAKMHFRQAQAEVNRLENELAELTDESRRENLKSLLDEKRQELERRTDQSQDVVEYHEADLWIWVPMGSLFLLVVVLFTLAIPGTNLGWKSLQRIRALNLPEGRGSPMFAALFWPLLLLDILLFALIALPMSYGPRWVGALGISLSVMASIAADFYVIRAVLRWLNSPATDLERAAVLAESQRTEDPWKHRIFWLVVAILVLPVVLLLIAIALYMLAGPGGGSWLAVVVLAVAIGLIVMIVKGFRSVGRTVPEAGSPWPRRIFWLIALLVLVPMALFGIMLLAWGMSYNPDAGQRRHSVEIKSFTENENSVTVTLETRRLSGGNVRARVHYEGPELSRNLGHEDHDNLYPGQGQEWNLYGDQKVRTDTMTFVLPDRETAEMAASMVSGIIRGNHQQAYLDTRKVGIFNVMTAEAGPWKAWIEMESSKPGSGATMSSIDLKVTGVEIPPGTHRLLVDFERSGDRGLYFEVAQDVIPSPEGNVPAPGWRGPKDTLRLMATQTNQFVWTLPAEFNEEDMRAAALQIEEGWMGKTRELTADAVPEFATLEHPEGWKYVLFAKVKREALDP